MGKIIIYTVLFLLALIIITPKPVLAIDCKSYGINYYNDPALIPEDQPDIKMVFTGFTSGTYRLKFPNGALAGAVNPTDSNDIRSFASGGLLTIPISNTDGKLTRGVHIANLEQWEEGTSPKKWNPIGSSGCDIRYKVGYEFNECRTTLRPNDPRSNEPFAIDVSNAPKGNYKIRFASSLPTIPGRPRVAGNLLHGNNDISIDKFGKGSSVIGPLNAQVGSTIGLASPGPADLFCDTSITIRPSTGASPRPIPSPVTGGTGTGPAGSPAAARGVPCDTNGFQTAIGCIHTEPAALVEDVMTFVVGISGGFAFLMMLLGAFQMLTSAGNPETLATGKDRFTNAIIGLLFVIFAVLLLQIIGFDILRLPDFAR